MSEPCRIQIAGGLFALVDAEDYERLSRFRWHLKGEGRARRYAQRTLPRSTKKLPMHREVVDAQPGQVVDHINGDTLDNRRSNLRVCSVADNNRNVLSSKNQKRGGFNGVNWNPRAKKWQANVSIGGVQLYLGVFADPADAARAYDAAALAAFGEFAALNFPEVQS